MPKFTEKLLTIFKKKEAQVNAEEKIKEELLTTSEFYRLLTEKGAGLVRGLIQTVVQTKRDLVDLVDAYKDTFFHVALTEMIVDDVLSVDPVTNEVVQLYSEDEEVNKVLEELQERIDLDNFIQSIAADIVAYGDYVVLVKHDGEKVLELQDAVDQRDVLVVYKAGEPKFLIKLDKYVGDSTVADFLDFIHFCVPGKKIRIKVGKEFAQSLGTENITEYFHVGKPLFWGCWDLLNSLYMLLVFYPVFAVQKLNATTIVGVKIPKEVPPAKAYEIARKYQELMNVSIGVDRLGRVSVADVLDTIGRYKVIPIYAEDERGLLQLNDPRLQEEYGLDIVEELKREICATVGIPHQLLFGSAEGVGRLEALKAFNRYVKKIARIQSAIKRGLVQLALIECRLRGMRVPSSTIEVRFRNNIISVEHLDRLEFLAGMIETVSSTVERLGSIVSSLNAKLNVERVVEFVNQYFGIVGLHDAIVQTSVIEQGDELPDVEDYEGSGTADFKFTPRDEFSLEGESEEEEDLVEFPFQVEGGGTEV